MRCYHKFIIKESGIILAGTAFCSAIIVGFFALLGHFDSDVLLGAVVGTVLCAANFFFMAVSAMIAANQAERQRIRSGESMIRASHPLRMGVLFFLLFAFGKSGLCDPVTLVLPFVFVRPVIAVAEIFRKSGDSRTCM